MAVLNPVRLDHVKRTIRNIVRGAVDDDVAATSVVWAEQGIPREPRPLVALSLVTGPTADGTIKDEKRERFEVTSVVVTIDSAVATALYRIRVNGIAYDVTSGAAPTVTTIRDAFLILLNNTTLPVENRTKQAEPITAVATAGDMITITPSSAGGIYRIDASPAGLISAVTNVDNTALTTHLIGRRRMLFDVNIYTVGGVAIELSSRMLAERIVASLDLESTLETISNARVPMRREGDINDLTGLESDGATLESRAQFSIVAFVSSRIAETTTAIDVVEITTSVDGNTETFTVTAP